MTSLRAKSKNVRFCCAPLKEKVEWSYEVALVVILVKVSVVAIGLWTIREERPKNKAVDGDF